MSRVQQIVTEAAFGVGIADEPEELSVIHQSGMVDEWMRGEFSVDPYITHHMTHGQINTAFDLLKAGESIRSVVHFQPGDTMTVNSLPGEIVPE